MFELGFTEMMLAGVVALIVLGPERLPIVARKTGQWLGKLQSLASGAKNEWAKHAQDFQATAHSIEQDLHQLKQDVQQQTHDITHAILPENVPAWERLPEHKIPADFGVDDMGASLSGSLKTAPAWHTPSLRQQALTRRRDMRSHRPVSPKLRGRK